MATAAEMGSSALELCSDARDERDASAGARERREADGLGGGGRDSPEWRAGVGEDGGAICSTAARMETSLGTPGDESEARTSFAGNRRS